MVKLVPMTAKQESFQFNTLNQKSQSTCPPPLARKEVFAKIKNNDLHWKISINDWREYNMPSHHGMRVGTMKQSYAEDFIEQKKKQNC